MQPHETKPCLPLPAEPWPSVAPPAGEAGAYNVGNDRAAAGVQQLLARCLALDLETNGDRIHRLGALLGAEEFERKGRFATAQALAELDRLAEQSDFVIGHNLLGFDLPLLRRLFPQLSILKKPVIDTLYLSPLAFPENPYHRLVKDYKLVKDSLSDPVADARLALSLFRDQWQVFAAAAATKRIQLLSFYRYCLQAGHFPAESQAGGFDAVFAALHVPTVTEREAAAIFGSVTAGRACATAANQLIGSFDRSPEFWPALAYSAAWLRTTGSNSVLPPWVRYRFPNVVGILHQLRDVPCKDPACPYCRSTHDAVAQLQRYFGFDSFRPSPGENTEGDSLQQVIVEEGMRERPLLAILSTGGGKSLCYQLPALVRHFRRGQLTIVISPLQALMKDQVDNLLEKTGTPSAAALNGLLTPPERGEVLEQVRLGDIALLYVAPEQLRNRSFRETIAQREIGCWVFDEAHCLSKWGHDFRPDYLYAGRFIREFAAKHRCHIPPIACFTATAKLEVKQEIIDFFRDELGQSLVVLEGSVERENLRFEVQPVTRAEKSACLHRILSERLDSTGTAVIYTATRINAEDYARFLQLEGWPVEAFHAGLSAPEKRRIQESFIAGESRVICATNAFGMGIDKEDVRLVIHADIPGSLENYLQEAGRAGRDLKQAECILLYDEHDVETQFRLGALSELKHRDIVQILRGLRRARRNERNDIVITAGELLRAEEVQTTFGAEDRQYDTKVKAAIAWLERSGFLQRNENDTRVFQGKPLVKNLDEARRKIATLNLSPTQQRRWLAILQALMNADLDQGFSADELVELPELKDSAPPIEGADGWQESDTLRVLRTLHDMAQAGLIKQGLQLNAYVRYKTKNHSQLIFDKICSLEEAMLKIMREMAPDAAEQGWLELSLRKLNQRLVDDGHDGSSPHTLLNLLKSLRLDGRGLAGQRGSLQLLPIDRNFHKVRLQRSWDALLATAERRRRIARTVLHTILQKIPADAPASAEYLVNFSSDDLLHAVQLNIYLAGQLNDPLAAIDRALMFLHEQKVITLQQGLTVFRQAMTIRFLPGSKGRRYGKGEFEPLQLHYKERTLQIHVMNEYARLGLEKIRQALELVLAYFTLDRIAFLRRYFPKRKELLERATSQESYRQIVDELANSAQIELVTAEEDENTLILAGPGSGKTRTVVHRCAYLIRVKRRPARGILVLCFNRQAATMLRRRLFALIGADAGGITVKTYHGLAMILTGTSFAEMAEKGREGNLQFDELIRDAVKLLRGEKAIVGIDEDEIRERLLDGYSDILVDEYQDIDQDQYDLISALAGRNLHDPEGRLTILAVGDDDQNIYTFRGANVAFIRRFQADYQARIHYLLENYRSSRHIIDCANQLIQHNQDRMKTNHEIRVNDSRRDDPAGGRWAELDPVTGGRVQVLEVSGPRRQAAALADEIERLRRLDKHLQWSDCAVLARTREALHPVRALLERRGLPVRWPVDRDKAPPLHRVREIAAFLESLKARGKEQCTAAELLSALQDRFSADRENMWIRLMTDSLVDFQAETADQRQPVARAIEYLYEAFTEQRRDHTLGQGIHLSTVHGAKGMEFNHVFMLDDGWAGGRNLQAAEEERRTYYVGMTRARETLCLLACRGRKNPYVRLLPKDAAVWRLAAGADDASAWGADRRYELLGLQDIYLSFAARYPAQHKVHAHLAKLQPGAAVTLVARGGRVEVMVGEDCCVTQLSKAAANLWSPRLKQIERVQVVGMIVRHRSDSEESFHSACACDSWEVPWLEVQYRVATSHG